MPDNISVPIYIATHLAAAICTSSLQTSNLTKDALPSTARTAVNVFLAVREAVIEELKNAPA